MKPGKHWEQNPLWNTVSIVFPMAGVLLSLIYLFHWRPFGWVTDDAGYLYLLAVIFVPLCFLWKRIERKVSAARVPWYDIVLMALSFVAPLYLFFNTHNILTRGWAMGAPLVPLIFSVILWVLMIEAGRRSAGSFFAAVLLFFSVYPLFSSYMPGLLQSPSFGFNYVASFHALGPDSIRGVPLKTFGTLIIGFMIFAAVLQTIGAANFFMQLAEVLVGKTRGGQAKVAVVASALFGTVDGSAVANVMTTGPFTIPAMKKAGFPPHLAAAVEATASSGGTLTPPVMGAVAFIMAEFIGVPYSVVAIAAAAPAVLYFVCLFSQIDAFAARVELKPMSIAVRVPPIWRTIVDNFQIVLPFALLIYVLFFLRLTAQSAFIAAGAGILLGMFRKETRLNMKGFISLFKELGRVLSFLVCVMAPVGLIIGGLVITGVAFSLPYGLVGLAHGNVIIVLILGALASLILGMGVTTAAVYIFLAIVLAPALVTSGFSLIGAHLFVLYTAVWSTITPPVAIAAFAAAGIAGADPMKTGFTAMKLGAAKYILPFVFVYNPALLLQGEITDMLWAIPTAAIGLVIISGALEGYFWGLGKLTYLSRILLFGSGLLVALTWITPTLVGLGISTIVVLVAKLGLFRKIRKWTVAP